MAKALMNLSKLHSEAMPVRARAKRQIFTKFYLDKMVVMPKLHEHGYSLQA
jgi:hypothetical protein